MQEQSSFKMTNELRRFIEVDSHEAVKTGDLEKNSEAIKVARPKFNQEGPSAKGHELALPAGEAGLARTFVKGCLRLVGHVGRRAVPKNRKAVIREESAETQDSVSCQDMEVDSVKSLE